MASTRARPPSPSPGSVAVTAPPGCSKAHANLNRILALIRCASSPSMPPFRPQGVVPADAPDSELPQFARQALMLHVDLSIRSGQIVTLGSQDNRDLSGCSVVGGSTVTCDGDCQAAEDLKRSQGDCELTTGVEGGGLKGWKQEQVAQGKLECLESTDVAVKTSGEEEDSEDLGLLLEAVRQVSGAESGGEAKLPPPPPPPTKIESNGKPVVRSKRGSNNFWMPFDLYEIEEDSGPVARSKRGRNQTLPSRYRDSVLEPWGKLPAVNTGNRTPRTHGEITARPTATKN